MTAVVNRAPVLAGAGRRAPATVATAGVRPLLLGADVVPASRLTGSELLARIDATGLRGRGGAGFPLAMKLRSVAAQPGTPVAVANGEEGEPGSVKDRFLMRTRPDLLLAGLALVAEIVGADRRYAYVSDPVSACALRAAGGGTSVVEVAPSYVAGEETALVRYIDGGPALPVAKPPRPYEKGIGGAPTLVSNVETLVHVALLAAGIDATDRVLLTVSGRDRAPELVECAYATPIGELLGPESAGALMGGMFGGLVPAGHLAATTLGDAGAMLGNGTIHVFGPDECPVDVAADALSYLAAESSRQCGVCVSGTKSLADAVAALRDGTATDAQVANVARWAAALPGRGACGLLDAAARVAGSLGRHFGDTVSAHVTGSCGTCARSARSGGDRFLVTPPIWRTA